MENLTIVFIRNAASYDFGGGERFPVFLARVLREQALNPVIISRNPRLLEFAHDERISTIRGWWWSRQRWSGARLLLLPAYIVWQVILFLYYLILFTRLNPKAVHIQSKDDFIAGTLAARLVGARVVWTDHADLKHIWRNLSVWYKNPIGKMVYFSAHFTHAITVVSESERVLVSENLPEESRITKKLVVVYNGCDDVFEQYPKSTRRGITYILASRLVTDKGIGETLTAFGELHEKHADTSLLIIGEGPESKKFKKQAKAMSGVQFLGYQTNPYGFIADADIFLLPTYHEGFSVALVEASMLEMPIIATNVGGNIEIIHDNKTGLLIPPKDSTSLLVAMQRLYGDDSLRVRLARAARRQYTERFVFDQIVINQFIPLYSQESR